MKKVLMVATYGDFFASFETDNIKILNEMGCEVHLCANWTDSNYNYKHDKLIGLSYKKINIEFERSPYSLRNIDNFKQLSSIINENEYCLVDCHNAVIGVYSRIAAKKNKIPKIMYTAHGFQFFRGGDVKDWIIYYPIEKLISVITDTIIVINNEDYNLAKNKFHMKNIVKIPGVGVDTRTFKSDLSKKKTTRQKFGLKDKDFVLLSVGEVSKRKNHIVIIEALKKIKNPNIYFFIVGRGDQVDKLKKKVIEYNLDNNVFFEGHQNDVNSYIQMSDLFVFPSLREGLGIAALEAMAANKPLLSSNVQGIKDYSINEETGFAINPNSAYMFANKITQLFDNRSQVEQYGIQARNIAERFDVKEVRTIMTKVYSELING